MIAHNIIASNAKRWLILNFFSCSEIMPVIIGFILIGYYCIKSYELKKKAKDQTSETEEY